MFNPAIESKDEYIKRRYLEDGIGTTTIGKELEMSEQSVSKRIAKMGFPRRPKKQLIFDKDHQSICDMYISGISADDIGKEFKMSGPVRVLQILRKGGVQIRNVSQCHIKYPLRDDYFDNIDTPEKAYVLGLIYADGYNCKQANFVSIALAAKDIDILYKVSSLIYHNDSKERVRSFIRNRVRGEKIFEEKGATLGFNRKHFCEVLDAMGCKQGKSLTCEFPEWLTDEILIPHFIRGYYDGDGGIDLGKNNKGALLRIIGTLPFMDKITCISKKKLGINWYMPAKTGEYLIRPNLAGSQQCRAFLDWIYKDSTIHMDRKYNLYKKLMTRIDENPSSWKGMKKLYVDGAYQGPFVEEKDDVSYDPEDYEIDEENEIIESLKIEGLLAST